MPIGMAIASVVGGVAQASAVRKGEKSQKKAADAQLELQGRMYDETVTRFDPYYQSGLDAQNALAYENGLGPKPTFGGQPLAIEEYQISAGTQGSGSPNNWASGQIFGGLGFGPNNGSTAATTGYRVGGQEFATRAEAEAYAAANGTQGSEYQGFQATPGYQFALGQGLGAIDRSAASRGQLFSGATMKDLTSYGTGMANQEYSNYYNRLAGMASNGQNAAGQQSAAGQNYAQGGSNALANYGNAAAAGAIGQGNAINNTMGNLAGVFQYQSGLNNNGQGVFGGNSWS